MAVLVLDVDVLDDELFDFDVEVEVEVEELLDFEDEDDEDELFDFEEVPVVEELLGFDRLRDGSAGAAVGRGSAPKKTCGCAGELATAGAPRARGTVDDSSTGAGAEVGAWVRAWVS
ncbi:hypothetical protein ACFU99_40870 [Streptomyces sp. NPDC057654]|uniref:hypothetical protein n=1 Tax=Streptomyces sp. NPDC057654 TaxID=3346196 RepID=UPI00369E4434